MINQKSICGTKLIAPKLIHYNENEKKNESPSSDSKMSVKQIIKPKPLNINLITGINNKIMSKKEELIKPKFDLYGKPFNQKIYMSDYSFSK